MSVLKSLALAALLICGPALAETPADNAVRVDEVMLTAKIFYPEDTGPAPAILVLGGAEGGGAWAEATAQMLSANGYVAMAETYFKATGLPDQLQRVPLERFSAGIDRLVADPRIDPARIAILGLSKGAEAALLIASRDKRIKAVVAGSPSDVVWQGIDRKTGSVESSWTLDGEPLSFVPFAPCAECRSLVSLYANSHPAAGTSPDTAIPVERIGGPVLLLASESDGVWPSQPMADAIARRLSEHQFAHAVVTLRYPDGGHFTLGPLAPDDAETDAEFGGGTPTAVVAARRDSWPRVLSFLGRALRCTHHDEAVERP